MFTGRNEECLLNGENAAHTYFNECESFSETLQPLMIEIDNNDHQCKMLLKQTGP